jgi:membrane protein implicated in regulation of membrane protease activity
LTCEIGDAPYGQASIAAGCVPEQGSPRFQGGGAARSSREVLVPFVSSLLAWANVPFMVALGVAVGFALLQMTGLLGLLAGGGDHEGDADHDVDGGHEADHEADAGHDTDADHDADADGDNDHDHDHDADQDESPGLGQQLLVGLGVGRVPLSIIWQTYAVAFGFAGFAANTVYLSQAGALPAHNLLWTVPGAAVFGYLATRVLARAVGRLVSNPAQEATTRKQLVGHSGVVISTRIDAEFGEVRVKDKTGHTLRVICRTRDGDPIPEGREVVIVDWDREGDRLYVAPLDAYDEAPRPRSGSAS